MAIAPWVYPTGQENIGERSISVFEVNIRRSTEVIFSEKIEIPVVVEISPDRIPEGVSRRTQPSRERGLSKDWNCGQPADSRRLVLACEYATASREEERDEEKSPRDAN